MSMDLDVLLEEIKKILLQYLSATCLYTDI